MTLHTIDAWSMKFNWNYNPELNNLKGTLRKYKVYYKAIDNERDTEQYNVTVNNTVYSMILTNLLPFTNYEVYIVAVSMYEGVESDVLTNKTLEYGRLLVLEKCRLVR